MQTVQMVVDLLSSSSTLGLKVEYCAGSGGQHVDEQG